MAENNTNIESLKLYDANKVTAAIRVFHEHCRTFDQVSAEVLSVKNDIVKVWEGNAADMFEEKFKTVYSQVTDIGDALYEIYNMLQQAQDAFYQADDSLNQQMKQAAHNDSKKSGGSSSSSSDSWSTVDVGQHNTPEQYVPNITYPPMQPIPVPNSTIGESYNPNFFYENFQAMPVIGHAVPSPYTVQMLYDNKTVKEIIAHNVSEAAQYVLEYDAMNPLDMFEHDVPEAHVPELTYDAMTPKEVVPHNVPEAYVPEFAYDTMTPQDVVEHGTGEPTRPGFSYDSMTPQDVVEHGTGEAERPEFAYDTMTPQDVVEHGTEEANNPELAYDAMTPKDVVEHGTEEAYNPELAYDAMTPKDVVEHGTGEAYNPEFAYEAMTPKDVVEHGTGEAYVPEFAYDAMTPMDVTPHDVPEAYVPEFTYATMNPVEIPQSTVGEMYFPAFMEMPKSRKDRLYSSISAGVVNAMSQGMAEGVDPTTLKLSLGSSVIDMLAPSSTLDSDTRQKLALEMGNKVYETICGSADATNMDVMEGLVDNTTAWTKDNMNTAISNIMEGAATPVCNTTAAIDAVEVASLKPAVMSALDEVDVTSIGSSSGIDQNIYMMSTKSNASSLLGSSGTEGIDASGLSTGLQTVSNFSMRMSVSRVLTDSTVKNLNADVDTSALDIPVVNCVPSLTETKVDCSNGSITWTITADSSNTVLSNALVQFSNSPQTVSGQSASALRDYATSTMSATSLRLPDLSARFN